MPGGKRSDQFPKVENDFVIETFSDSLGQVTFDGQILRIEFCAIRFADVQDEKDPKGNRHVVSRIVMTPEGAVELFARMMHVGNVLKQTGVMTEQKMAPGSGAKN